QELPVHLITKEKVALFHFLAKVSEAGRAPDPAFVSQLDRTTRSRPKILVEFPSALRINFENPDTHCPVFAAKILMGLRSEAKGFSSSVMRCGGSGQNTSYSALAGSRLHSPAYVGWRPTEFLGPYPSVARLSLWHAGRTVSGCGSVDFLPENPQRYSDVARRPAFVSPPIGTDWPSVFSPGS